MIDRTLDLALERFRAGDAFGALTQVSEHLNTLRAEQPDQLWTEQVKATCDAHPLNRIVLQDPLTRRAREKPRGYAGDAVMIEFMYSRQPPAGVSDLGQKVFAFTADSPAGRAVRWRLRYLAGSIDAVAARKPGARVLSLACGHLREAEHSKAVRDGGVSALLALDQDAESLAVVRRDYGHLPCVRAAEHNVHRILRSGLPEGDFDLAYAAGLYDYLELPVAQALTARLFDGLAPGGRLIVPNFLSSNYARGYMESFMEWNLIVRDRAAIEAIGATLPGSDIANLRYFEDPHAVVGYLEVTKRH